MDDDERFALCLLLARALGRAEGDDPSRDLLFSAFKRMGERLSPDRQLTIRAVLAAERARP
jgi:hypothetical protein